MKYRNLGKTKLQVSPLCIGAWQLGGPLAFDGEPDGHPDPGKENVLRMIHELGERGINCIDTAEQYSAGESENRVGEALKDRRNDWIISTKFGYRVSPENRRIDDSSSPTILSSLEGSLKRLQTDYVDIYLYHCAPSLDDLDASREILEQAKQAGKIRHYGISTGDLLLTQALVEKDMCDVLQFPANLLDPQHEIRNFANQNNLGLQLRGTMASGKLSGKYFTKPPQFSADDSRIKWVQQENYPYYAALQAACPEGYSMAQTAIRWTLDQPGTATICLGAKNILDYEAALAVIDRPPLTTEQATQLENLAQTLI